MTNLSPKLLAELNDAIANRHLESVADEIRKNACKCYEMVAIGEDDYSTIGNTRIGGGPDLPETFKWPTDEVRLQTKYCNFVAQINFAELPPLVFDNVLPQSGILYLFVRYLGSAADPVLIDAMYYDGELAALRVDSKTTSAFQLGENL